MAVYFYKPVSVNGMIELLNEIGNVYLNKSWFCIDTSNIPNGPSIFPWGFSTMIFEAHRGEAVVGFNEEKTTLLSNHKIITK